MIFDLIRIIIRYFRVIILFESESNKNKIYFKNFKLRFFKNLNNIKSKTILNYLNKTKKRIRISKNFFLLVLYFKKRVIGYGWCFEGKIWKITEINKVISLQNSILLFNFQIIEKERNKGFYIKFLTLCKNIKKNKKFKIYCLATNKRSKQGILNAGFRIKKIIKS